MPFDLSIVNLLDDPTVEGLVISGHDATAQMAVEHDLSEALSRLTATLDSTADGILVVDTVGKITDFNRRFAEIWGLPHNAVVRQGDLTTLAFALDQLTDPGAFTARLKELDLAPGNESFDLIEFKDGRVVERYSTAPTRRRRGRGTGLQLSGRHRPQTPGRRALLLGLSMTR